MANRECGMSNRRRASSSATSCFSPRSSARRAVAHVIEPCRPAPRSTTPSANLPTESDDVSVAAQSENIFRLTSMCSTTALIIGIAPPRSAGETLAGRMCAKAASRSPGMSFPFSIPRAWFFRIPPTLRSTSSGLQSASRSDHPTVTATWAIPARIVPAPMTARPFCVCAIVRRLVRRPRWRESRLPRRGGSLRACLTRSSDRAAPVRKRSGKPRKTAPSRARLCSARPFSNTFQEIFLASSDSQVIP